MESKELWMDIPGTWGQYQVSNFGHVRIMHKVQKVKDPIGERRLDVFASESVNPTIDFSTGEISWHIWAGGHWRYVSRNWLMSLFNPHGAKCEIDTTNDAELLDILKRHHEGEEFVTRGPNAPAPSFK